MYNISSTNLEIDADNQKSYCPLNDLLHVSKESDNNKAPDADNHRISQTVQNSELQLLIRGLHGMLIRTRDGARVLVVGLRQRIEKCRSWKQSAAGAPARLNCCPDSSCFRGQLSKKFYITVSP